jgi:SagB-type dehydrogenase family enzyme
MRRYLLLIIFIGCLYYETVNSVEGRDMKAKDKISLPKPRSKGELSLEETISGRRSVRAFSSKELSLEQISQLLWATQGITEQKRGFRAAPSAGALYPLEIYLITSDGIHYYDVVEHNLEKISVNDVRRELAWASWGQSSIAEAPISVIICAVRSRTTSRYGKRGNRYVDIEVGHAAENLHLQAVALGLGSVPIGAFTDSEIKRILRLPRDTDPVYIIPIGYTR